MKYLLREFFGWLGKPPRTLMPAAINRHRHEMEHAYDEIQRGHAENQIYRLTEALRRLENRVEERHE